MKRWLLFVALILLSLACGDSATEPQLSELTLSQTTIRFGDEFFVSFEANDPDGDLHRAEVAIRVNGPEEGADEEVELEQLVGVTEVLPGQTEVSMAVALRLTGRMPTGVYQLEVRVTDGGGNESEPATTRLNLTF